MKDILTLEIDTVAFGGHGIGRADGLVVFVPFTAPGDIAKIEITARRKKFARGRLIEIIRPSPHRTTPLCPYFGQCGGCSYQHIDYESQLKIKQAQVLETFARIGGIPNAPVAGIIASPAVYAYRGKARLHTARAAGRLKLGFMDVSGERLVDIRRCEIVDETINEQIERVRSTDEGINMPDELTFWSYPHGDFGDGVSRVVLTKEFSVPHDGFFQANLHLTDRLVAEVGRLLARTPGRTVLDACCGAGLFSVLLAHRCRRVIGVEINEQSVAHARKNALRHNVANAEFICADLQHMLKNHDHRRQPIDLAILNPPRTGLAAEVLHMLGGAGIPEIIYISCDPATQARDVRLLTEKGYNLISLQPLDMFPQTRHVEVVAFLQKELSGKENSSDSALFSCGRTVFNPEA